MHRAQEPYRQGLKVDRPRGHARFLRHPLGMNEGIEDLEKRLTISHPNDCVYAVDTVTKLVTRYRPWYEEPREGLLF